MNLSDGVAPGRRGLLGSVLQTYVAALSRSHGGSEQRIYQREAPMHPVEQQQDGRHDFDFCHGHWQVRNERLRQRLAGSQDWETFEAAQHCRPILGGLGNLDEFSTGWGGGFLGMTLRLFDPRTRQWSIYWASNRDGVLEPPVVGAFRDGIGTFYGRDRHQGQPVLTRFIWDDISADSAHWQQALSVDGGASWETNWHMFMTRVRR
ncbi:hypothetical protein [Pseudoxanthomonas wuyuanensis]|uniref:DUF1579 domain-containing protein n=1 Tax=Pseudoxanthomonas wuyuanensis TaxID=1073196 RepID=A0A286DF18_9GAMM|nr:hypothetical protein [Pseudoxanthomonas wuyuanensis]SOD57164.1 hypothetical protein SAMN06296416_11253 [Pseudoxanthomonas wuyuanensis]